MAQLKTLPTKLPRPKPEHAEKGTEIAEPRTEPREAETGHDTERVSYAQVVLDANQGERLKETIDWTSPFSFERERMQALQMTELYRPQHCSSEKSLIIFSPPANSLPESIVNWNAIVHVQKLVSMIGVLYGVVCLLAWFFALSYISITSLPVTLFLSWLSEEFVAAGLLIYLSARGYYSVGYRLSQANCQIVLLVGYLILLLTFLMAVAIWQGLASTLTSAQQWDKEGNTTDENVEAMLCIVILALFFSTLAKALVVLGYTLLALRFRRTLALKVQSQGTH